MAAATVITKPAFKVDVNPHAIKRVETIGMPPAKNRALKILIGSVAIHAAVFVIRPDLFMSPSLMNLEENWDVDVDFMGEISMKAPQDTALPKSQKSEEEAVPANLLPQLPKKFQVEEQKPVEEKNTAEEKDKKAEDAVAEKKVQAEEKPVVPKTEEDANKVDMDDLRKRLAVEKLKQENKVSERMKAQKDALAKLKQDLKAENSDKNTGSSGGMLGVLRNNAYGNALKSAVKRNFNLPENFKYTQQKMAVPLIVVINDHGDLVSLKLTGSSGSEVYDSAVIAAIKNSVPLPPPPRELAGREIQFNFGM